METLGRWLPPALPHWANFESPSEWLCILRALWARSYVGPALRGMRWRVFEASFNMARPLLLQLCERGSTTLRMQGGDESARKARASYGAIPMATHP